MPALPALPIVGGLISSVIGIITGTVFGLLGIGPPV
jgi:hypothetical protein